MNRLLLISTALLGGLMPLAIDSALKGAVLLSMAALAALSMRRASAAARHLVWLVAVVALLVVPLLTIALPQWRVLPDWAASPVQTFAVVTEKASVPSQQVVESTAPPILREQPAVAPAPAPVPVPIPALPSTLPVAEGSQVVRREASLPPEQAPSNARAAWLGLGWLLGFLLFALRLLASQVMLRRAARSCRTPDEVRDQRLVTLFNEARAQLGVRQPVRLMIDRKRTIPLVWGVIRPRLMLPAEARGWSDSALRSVLLHELAHLKRRDTAVQWLAQIACALHWWNPLVWLAAWRLHVEREKACDDLVLASGVQPSSYAEHLLHVASRLSPARWSSACGLAMARKSSLEGRLVAVLSERPNRRSVTRALVTAALLLGTGIAIPVAMLHAADEAWDSPKGAHIGSNDFSAFCVHDGKETAFVIAYHGFTGSSSALDSNPATRTWTNAGTLTAKKAGIELSFHRSHTVPGKVTLTTAPSGPRDLGQPAPPPRAFGQKEYELAQGRVFLLTDSGLVRQLDLAAPVVTDQDSLKKLAALIAAVPPQVREDLAPQHKDARALYEIWQRHARANGDIPGALIGELATAVKVFIGYNPTWETVPKLNEILPRLDATRDWTPADAIALLDEVAGVQDSPLQTAAEKTTAATILKGEALPQKFAGVAWGETQPNGLRAAWVLEPAAAEHRMGTALKARLLVQNTGNIPVMTRVPTWHQGSVSARDAAGAEVEVSGIEWTTLARLVPVRLAPGECIEINAPGIGLGNDAGRGPWAGPRVGSNVLAKDGVELTLTHGPLALDGSGVGMREDAPHLVGPGWWQAHIKARLSRELPLPTEAAERTRVLDRAVRELFSTPPTAEETAAFTADQTAAAFDALVQRLAARADVAEFSASLPLAPVKFRVLPVDSASDKTPRVVLGPGEYPLSETATLKMVVRPDGERYSYDTEIITKPSVEAGIPVPEKIEVPGNWGTWAIVCRPGEGFFYVLHKGGARKIDYSDPAKVTDTPATDLPAEFREEVKRQLELAGVPAESQAEVLETPATPDATPEPETSAVVPEASQLVTDGTSSAQVLRADSQEPIVILTGRALTASPDSTSRSGAVTMDVATSEKTITIRYTWPEDAPGFLDLRTGGYPVSRFDLSRGRVFFIHFEKMEFSADVFQVPSEVEVPEITSPGTLTQAAAAVTAWYAASDDRARWESSRIVVSDSEYKTGQPLDAAADKIVWGEANDVGLRLGLGGLEAGASYPVGQLLPVTQFIRNDSTQTIAFSPTQIFNEGVGGELVRKADGKKFAHKKGYPWQGFFHRVRLAPGHYIALGSGPMRTLMAEKDGSSPGGMDMMSHGFTVLPGDYTLQLTHDIGQFLGRPANFHFGDPRGAPGLGEWTGVLTSAAVPLRLVDEQVKTARAGDSEAFGRYMIAFDKGVLKLRHYNGYPNMSLSGAPWEAQSRDWKVPAADGNYVAAWAVGGKGIWVKDASGITHLTVKENLTENGRWTLDQASGGLGDMPAGVRAALQLPPLAALQPFDFKRLPSAPGAAKIEGEFFEMALSPGTVLKVLHQGIGFFVESDGRAYGPAQGNPVVELGLTDLLRARLAETPNTAGLEMLRHMIADGRGTIRDCGFRLLAELKAPQAPFDFDAVFHAMIHASIEDEHGPKELTPEAHLGYARLHNLFHSTRLEWERTRPVLAAGKYQPGEALSADRAIVWTPGPDGMSLGVSGLPAGTNLEIGKSVPVALYLRNDSAAPVKLSVPAEHNPVMQISLTDAEGKSHRAHYSFSAPLTAYNHLELAPGTAAKVAAFDLESCATPEEADRAEHKEGKAHNPRLAVPAGSYGLQLEYRNYQESPVPKGAASEWTGEVTASPVPVIIAAKGSAKLTPAMLSGFWSNGGLGREETVAVSFNHEDGGPKTADVYIGSGSIGLITTIELTEDGAAASVKSRNTNVGRLVSGEDGTLVFEIAASADEPGRSVPLQQRPDEQPEGKTPAESDATPKVQPGQPLPKKLESAPWGPAVNGLRMTLVWPPSHGEAGLGNAEEFHLVVQNVSDAEIRLFAGPAAPNPRRLVLRKNGGILSALGDPRVMPGDWNLKPREVAFLRLFQVREKAPDGRPVDATIEEDVRAFPQYSMTAEMNIDQAPAGAWTGKLVTGESRGSLDGAPPRNESAQALYKTWMTAARKDGKIPGGVIALLGESVKTFIKNNPTLETTPGLEKLLHRFDATRDWSGEEAVSLLDELAALQDTPIAMALDQERLGLVQTGTPLPAGLANAPWGEALPNGLRHAWLLEPRAAEQRLGTALKARVLIHNSGKVAVVFRTRSWHQLGHEATDAKGAEIKTESTDWLTRGPLKAYRLEPGEFIEISAPGIGVGPVGKREDWKDKDTRVGTWIEAKAGDQVTLTTAPLPLSDWNENPEADGEPHWWLDHIAARLSRHLPFPADKAARELMLYRVAMELFGTPVSLETNAAFVADTTPGALDALAERLFHRPEIHAWAGPLKSGPTTFRVMPADPEATK